MPTQKTQRITVQTPTGEKSLFRQFEMTDGKFCLEVISGGFRRDGTAAASEDTIKYQKISIHPSNASEHECTIHITQNGQNMEQSHNIGSRRLRDGKHKHLLSKRFSDFASAKYLTPAHKKSLVTCSTDPRLECLMAHVFARRTSSKALIKNENLYLKHSIPGQIFSVDILFTKIPFPALQTGFLSALYTSPPGKRSLEFDKGARRLMFSAKDSNEDYAEDPNFF
ncbi:hypothetical protein ACRARG_05410 [Pseudooceanicola sp. C21-150M6]|uniref:hypothetical protein n=1 Tax=Pseudooceanicola sp. C21-150M6 TaxID=3434355 RepID=UPI003D7FBB20